MAAYEDEVDVLLYEALKAFEANEAVPCKLPVNPFCELTEPVNWVPVCVFILKASTSNSALRPWSVTLKSPPVKLDEPVTVKLPLIIAEPV